MLPDLSLQSPPRMARSWASAPPCSWPGVSERRVTCGVRGIHHVSIHALQTEMALKGQRWRELSPTPLLGLGGH